MGISLGSKKAQKAKQHNKVTRQKNKQENYNYSRKKEHQTNK